MKIQYSSSGSNCRADEPAVLIIVLRFTADCIDLRRFPLTTALCYGKIYIKKTCVCERYSMKKIKWTLLGILFVVIIGILTAVFMEAFMSSNYVMKFVRIGSDNEQTYEQEFAVHEGDVILDKGFSFTVLPRKFDFSKPVRKKPFSNQPEKTSERLLRVKELNEYSAVIAILQQNTYIDGNMIVTEESESIRTVRYGKTFSVYAKEQIMDMPGGVMYTFVIEDTGESESKTQKYCTECGNKLTKGDKFCRECGTAVG